MIDPMAKYREALQAFAAPGGRWANKGALTYWGKAAGLSADDIVADVRAAGVTDRDADIRRGWNDARPKGEAVRGAYVPRAKPKPQPPKFKHYVRSVIGDLATAERATADWVRELSPCLDWIGKPPQTQTALFLRAAFRHDEKMFVFCSDTPAKGRPNVNIRTCADWLKSPNALHVAGDLVKSNPLTGKEGRNASGQPSFASLDCIADFPFVLLEFDAIPLPMQHAFWRAFILKCELAPALVSLVFSGGKSLHGLLHVGCHTPDEWQAVRQRLIALFASDEDARFRVDPQALHPLIGTRLPGVRRRGNGELQELVYLNPCARFDTKGGAPC